MKKIATSIKSEIKKKAKKSFKKKKKRKARELLIYYIKFCRKSGFFLRFFPGEGPPPPSESWSSFECSACVGKQRKRERRAGRQTRQDWACMREPSSKFLFFFPATLWLSSHPVKCDSQAKHEHFLGLICLI